MEVEHNIKCDIRIDDGTKEISEKEYLEMLEKANKNA